MFLTVYISNKCLHVLRQLHTQLCCWQWLKVNLPYFRGLLYFLNIKLYPVSSYCYNAQIALC